jgi:hypothetical protein
MNDVTVDSKDTTKATGLYLVAGAGYIFDTPNQYRPDHREPPPTPHRLTLSKSHSSLTSPQNPRYRDFFRTFTIVVPAGVGKLTLDQPAQSLSL